MAAQNSTQTTYTTGIFEPTSPLSNKTVFSQWLKDIFNWWYISTPVWYVLSLRRLLTIIDDQFSMSLLLLHFFTPWHRDSSFVGYLIGLIMKVLFLPIGIIVFLVSLVAYLSFILIWFLLPVVTILGIIFTPFLSLIQ